jgi:hypothetical protein
MTPLSFFFPLSSQERGIKGVRFLSLTTKARYIRI